MEDPRAQFEAWFKRATDYEPFPYQTKFAIGEGLPQILQIPTGLGKTACAVLGWLWRRRFASESVRNQTPRRLVYCLPMRVLVEQTRDTAILWLRRLDLIGGCVEVGSQGDREAVKTYTPCWDDPEKIVVSTLMGGEDAGEWDLYPERDAIVIGTQDMLLSRALNRGYGMSRYRWPMHFGLLGNDCLWLIDEVQLMGNGLATTAQMQAFARQLGVISNRFTIWASATLDRSWLHTVDVRPDLDLAWTLTLQEDDKKVPEVRRRLEARKEVKRAKGSVGGAKELATEVLATHRNNSRTLVVVNTVKRALELFTALNKTKPKPRAEMVLLHSRFRPPDRARAVARLLAEPGPQGMIVVSTQVVEAGVDVSAQTLFTELAPWPSLVQRFGRCNRRGEYIRDAAVYWLNLPGEAKQQAKLAAPYDLEELLAARDLLSSCEDAAPAKLPAAAGAFFHPHVLRRKDLVELFDTTPDLAGFDVDVSRFIRETSDLDVQVFWRDIAPEQEPDGQSQPGRDELCPVAIGDIRELIAKEKNLFAWTWDSLEGRWQRVNAATPVYPGIVLMLRAADGRCSEREGWNPKANRPVPVIQPPDVAPDDRNDAEPKSLSTWMTLAEHTDHVVREAERITAALELSDWRRVLLDAARWHDAGKAHEKFQETVRQSDPVNAPPGILAKTPNRFRHKRRGFRHELASGLLAVMHGKDDLLAYLAAAHHGKVRLSLRSLPTEEKPDDPARRFARGIWDGDRVLAADLGGGVWLPETLMDLTLMELGESERYGPSWMARVLALRDRADLGPFRLALLEAVMKAADERASSAEAKQAATGETK